MIQERSYEQNYGTESSQPAADIALPGLDLRQSGCVRNMPLLVQILVSLKPVHAHRFQVCHFAMIIPLDSQLPQLRYTKAPDWASRGTV